MDSILPGLTGAPNVHPIFVHFPVVLWPTALLLLALFLCDYGSKYPSVKLKPMMLFKKPCTGTIALASLFLFLTMPAKGLESTGEEHSFAYLRKQFASPDKRYGSAPLWVWNAEVNREVIDTMMQEFKDNAFGGVFVHPRPGLITEYLSDEWFDLFKHAVEKGEELGLDVWIYDENSYPSGFAGGHVPDQMPESFNQGQMLRLVKTRALPDTAERFFICLREVGGKFEDITDQVSRGGFGGASKGAQPEPGDSPAVAQADPTYYLFEKTFYPRTPWYGGFSYVDLMVKGVTEKFIEVTMQGYEKHLGAEFGNIIPGIFTDEPNIDVEGDNSIRWTPDLFDAFQKKWGYNLRTRLPSLFEETGDWKRVRHNYYQTLLQLFIDRWSKPWHDYTEEKGLEWTGHYWEHGWPDPKHGGDNMAMYAWHQRPGIDMLFNQFNEESPNAQFGNIRAVKELSSVANQLGKRRTLSETYGGGGWELTFQDMKRLGDWEYVLGVNTLNQHLAYMTIMGARKYDYPPSFSYHNPWWPYYKDLNRYFARLSLALSRGRQRNDILILEPTTSAWMYSAYQQSHPRRQEIGQEFQSFITALEKAQVEYDLGSENIFKDHGRVKGKGFVIGEREYTTVVIPPGMENVDGPTFKLLSAYAGNGGKLLLFDTLQRIDGRGDKALQVLDRQAPNIIRPGALDNGIMEEHFRTPEISFFPKTSSEGNLYHHRRRLKDGQLLFLVNSSMGAGAAGEVRIRGQDVVRLDPFTGKLLGYPSKADQGEMTFRYDLPPAGSLLLFIADHELDVPEPDEPPGNEWKKMKAGKTRIERVRPNVLSIDFCDLRVGEKVLREQHVTDAASTAFKLHGFENGNPWNTSVQFKKQTVQRDAFPPGTGFKASYHFTVAPGTDMASLKAVVERPDMWEISINGRLVEPEKGRWWLDKAFAVVDIGDLVSGGKNTLELHADPMRVHAEIEPVYILGNFDLEPARKGFNIIPASGLKTGSWKNQGLAMYGHEVSYRKQFTINVPGAAYSLRLPSWKGTLAVVSVNGRAAGNIGWPPYTLDISEFIRAGRNEIDVRVIGSLKNTLGPHHNDPAPGLVSPWHWRNVKRYPPGSEYDLYDYGLMEDFEVLRK